MVKVTNISKEEAQAFLQRAQFGHLAYADNDQPFVVPINFAYDHEHFYFRTTDGSKTRALSHNPKICLQVERIESHEQWESVMVTGLAEPLTSPREIERVNVYFAERKLPHPPEMNKASLSHRGGLVGETVTVYRIRLKEIRGRRRSEAATEA